MPHRHHFHPREALPEPVVITIHSTVTVTPTPSSSHVAPVRTSYPPNPETNSAYHRVGVPIAGSSSHTSSISTPLPVYHAPIRHQRPSHSTSHQSSSHSTSSTHHSKPSSSKASSTSAHTTTTSAEHKHHGAGSIKAPESHQSNHANLHVTSEDQGMSGGAKAGLVIGLLLLIALVGALGFLFYRRKKNQNDTHQPLDDEKSNLHRPQDSILASNTGSEGRVNAPRLSLRPLTEFFPNMSEKRKSAGSVMTKPAGTPGPELSIVNPEAAKNPFDDDANITNDAEHAAVAAPGAAVPKPLSVKSERTGTGIAEHGAASNEQSTTAAGSTFSTRRLSPPGTATNNVHRVQLDFNPSMDDELGLRAGQLVRMLHEYDDGWALCIRLDRSQQGVVPRTCISKLPVKPRPQGPPPSARGPQGRARGGPGAPAPRNTSGDPRQRSAAPADGRVRSQSNGQQARAQSPSPQSEQLVEQARPRANSDALSTRRVTPEADAATSDATSSTQGNSIPGRKAVPGQAM